MGWLLTDSVLRSRVREDVDGLEVVLQVSPAHCKQPPRAHARGYIARGYVARSYVGRLALDTSNITRIRQCVDGCQRS